MTKANNDLKILRLKMLKILKILLTNNDLKILKISSLCKKANE